MSPERPVMVTAKQYLSIFEGVFSKRFFPAYSYFKILSVLQTQSL
jgi:hypothetical protein